MDDRTTIAKELYVAWLQDCWRLGHVVTKTDTDIAMARSVQHTDQLLSELARTAKPTPQPAPAPARGVPVWRRIDDPRSHDLPVMLSRRGPKQLPAPAIYANRKCVWCETKTEVIAPQQFDWLDLNGFTPEVGE